MSNEDRVKEAKSLYDLLAEPAETRPTPDTIETKQIETIDNDRATTLLRGWDLS